ncbi:MAG TPA: hypothetical protein DDY78_13640 [Planctomycetales bacterium]|jgi:hypothetical protein|nr:hypothetical protein [Planctomycetales bacterium]
MRAICGAVIAAGALIGLGLACIGEGLRYASYPYHDADSHLQYVKFHEMDTALIAVFIGLALMALIGLGLTFLGLAYHHHRRHHEMLHLQGRGVEGTHRVGV